MKSGSTVSYLVVGENMRFLSKMEAGPELGGWF